MILFRTHIVWTADPPQVLRWISKFSRSLLNEQSGLVIDMRMIIEYPRNCRY